MTEQTPPEEEPPARPRREGKPERPARKDRPERADRPKRAERPERAERPVPKDQRERLAAARAAKGLAAKGLAAKEQRAAQTVVEVSPEQGRRDAAPVSENHVRLGYRLMMNRTPTAEEVAQLLPHAATLPDLRLAFLNSDEFDQKFARIKAERDAKRPPVLVHLHIPKTAGTTLAEAFAKEPLLQPQMVVHDETLNQLFELPASQRRGLRYIHGHLNMGVGDALGVPYRYLSTIRRPGPRIHSFYRFILRNRLHPSHRALVDAQMSFGDYLDYSRSQIPHRIEIDNGQIRRLAGQLGDREFGREQTYLPTALHHVLNPATIFGYVEHFDALLRRLVAEGYLSTPEVPASNVSPEGEGAGYDDAVAALNEGQRAIFEAYTVWDNYFYDLCLTLLPPE